MVSVTTGVRHILVINSGSSSLKFSLLDVQSESAIASGIAERLGTKEASLNFSANSAEKVGEALPNADHRAALRLVVDHILALVPHEVDALGHRIVHGGEYFRDAVIVDDEVIKRIEELRGLGPLQHPPGARGIARASELFPENPQVAVFDTPFTKRFPRRRSITQFLRNSTRSIAS